MLETHLTLGSLFDGSGGFPLAGVLSGITPVWASEVEPYPIAVTRSRFPGMRHLGDVTRVHGWEIEPVDVVTFGSPCQDMSLAGKRAGMKHAEKGDGETTRSGLFYEAIRIIKEMREATNGQYPKFAVWENVPGAFTSNGGEDFRCVLEALAGVCDPGRAIPRPASGKWSHAGAVVGDGYSIAWRVLDAQYWGVPQRRKRIYLVADFAGGRAEKILFDRDGLRGNPAPGGAPGEGAAADAAGSAGGSGDAERLIYALQGNGIDRAETAGCNGRGCREDTCYTLNTIDRPEIAFKPMQSADAHGVGASESAAPTLAAQPGGNAVPAICFPRVARTLTAEADASFCIDRGQNVMCYDARGNGDGAHCPKLTGDHEGRVTDYTTVAVYRNQKFGEYAADGTASTMAARDFKSPRDLVVEHPPTYGVDCRHAALDAQKTHTLQAKANGGQSLNCTPCILTSGRPPRKYIIRRLTPLECCRLQGFPGGWGVPDLKDKLSDEELEFWQKVRDTCAAISGKQPKKYSAEALTRWYNGLHTDSAEYKMWGNGIALPCAQYVLEGVADEMRKPTETEAEGTPWEGENGR